MQDYIFRKATQLDMDDIDQLQIDVFEGEQKIPTEIIPLSEEKSPQWWCVLHGTSIVGAVAAWKDNDQTHWGRFAIRQAYRGRHIGVRLAQFSLDDLFSQRIEEIYMDARDVTVKIVCGMGGKVVGEPEEFYDGAVTPVVLCKKDYYSYLL